MIISEMGGKSTLWDLRNAGRVGGIVYREVVRESHSEKLILGQRPEGTRERAVWMDVSGDRCSRQWGTAGAKALRQEST